MSVPWRAISLTSLVAAYVVTSRTPSAAKLIFASTFAASWALLGTCWALWAVFIYPIFVSPLRHLPEPKGGSWIHGQWAKIVKEPSGAPQTEWLNTIANDGLIRYRGPFNQERLLIASPKALAEVLVTKNYDFGKPAGVRFFLARLLGNGILLAEGDEHRKQRRDLMPAFAFRHVKELYPVFWRKATESVQILTDHILAEAARAPVSDDDHDHDAEKAGGAAAKDTATLEIGGWASRLTLDVIGVAGLGRDFNALRDPNSVLARTYSTVFSPNRQAQFLAMLSILLPDKVVSLLPVKRNSDLRSARAVIRSTCRDLIREKKDKLARKELADVDILSVALESGGFSDENLVDQLMTFLAAGHETTASAMTWAVYLLCRHPAMQQRLRDEIRAHLPSPDTAGAAAISSADVDRMPYLWAFASEVLRYYSPVAMTLREAVTDTTVQGVRVPRGTRVIISPWAVNKDERQWGADGRQFDPERWLPRFEGDKGAASGHAASNYAFMTFLHGPRSCIGMNFAKAEFACLLAAWAGRFEFRLRDEALMDEANLDIKGGVTARPAKGLWVKIRPVEGW